MHKSKNIKLLTILLFSISLIFLCGCEAMKKKFIRKHKGEEKEETEGVVFEPQEYPAQEFSNEQLYQNHYLLWKIWVQELCDSLQEDYIREMNNHKRQIGNAAEMVNNLEQMKLLLKPEYQSGLDKFIQEAKKIKDNISSVSLRISDFGSLKNRLMNLERNVRRNYSYTKTKNLIKK